MSESLQDYLAQLCNRLEQQGFQVICRCEKAQDIECSRQQRSVVEQVLAELFENIFRYGDSDYPVTVDARISENSFRLETRNHIRTISVDSSKMGLELATNRMLSIGGLLTYGKRNNLWQNLLQLEVGVP